MSESEVALGASSEEQPCPECKHPLDDRSGYPDWVTPVFMPGQPHYGWCPTLPHLTAEEEAKLRAELAELADARRRAMQAAHNIWIG